MENLNTNIAPNTNTIPLNISNKTLSKDMPSNKLSKNNDIIEETYNLLKDFGIFIRRKDIPRNLSTFDLHLWRRAKIKAYLQG